MTPDNKPRGGWLEYWQIFDKHGDMIRIGSIRGECPENGDKVVQLVERQAYADIEAKYSKAVAEIKKLGKYERDLKPFDLKCWSAIVLTQLGE